MSTDTKTPPVVAVMIRGDGTTTTLTRNSYLEVCIAVLREFRCSDSQGSYGDPGSRYERVVVSDNYRLATSPLTRDEAQRTVDEGSGA